MKRLALLVLILSAAWGKAWAYGVPGLSVDQDPELLTDTPIPIPHHIATHTPTATPSPTFTFTPTPAPSTLMAVPALTKTAALSPIGSMPSPTASPTPSARSSFQEQAFVELGLGVDPSIQGLSMSGTAAGAQGAVGVLFKDGFAVQLDVEYFSQSTTTVFGTLSESELLLLPTLRRYLAAGSARPYLSLSHGLAINTTTSGLTSSSADSDDMALGFGLEFLFENYLSAYVEAKYNFVFSSGSTNQDIPVVLGARLGL